MSLRVLAALASLLMASLLIMLHFSRMAVKEEALKNASQTLEATVQHIDNILLDVEQAAGNIYWKMLACVDQPDKLEMYCKKLTEVNPYIAGCAIVPDTVTTTTGFEYPYWTTPQKQTDTKNGAEVSFCLPIYAEGRKVARLVADVPVTLLSKIVLEAKPSPNSYCTLLGEDGAYIVHPDSSKLNYQTVFTVGEQDRNPAWKEAAKAMVAGEAGYKYVRLHGEDCYVFYKPFERAAVPGRSMGELGWSAGIVYPEDDIFGDYNHLLWLVLVIAVVGLLLLFVLCRLFLHHRLQPLTMLAHSAQHIAEGHYDEAIPASQHQDEIGRLQNHFRQMQESLATHVGQMEQLTATLQQRNEVLQAAYEQAQVADRMKVNFMHNMSGEMLPTVRVICAKVANISDHYADLTKEDTDRLAAEIQQWGDKITALLNQQIIESEDSGGRRKENSALPLATEGTQEGGK